MNGTLYNILISIISINICDFTIIKTQQISKNKWVIQIKSNDFVILILEFDSFFCLKAELNHTTNIPNCYDCCVQVWVICLTSDRKVEVKHYISESTHKPITLRFWVRVWRLSHLYGCYVLDVDGPPGCPRDPTMVSELGSMKGMTYSLGLKSSWEGVQAADSIAKKAATTVQASICGWPVPLWREQQHRYK